MKSEDNQVYTFIRILTFGAECFNFNENRENLG